MSAGWHGKWQQEHFTVPGCVHTAGLAETQNVAQVALEAGNSPQMIFHHYRELVQPKAAKAWFAISPK